MGLSVKKLYKLETCFTHSLYKLELVILTMFGPMTSPPFPSRYELLYPKNDNNLSLGSAPFL